jgi:hypothetical protein
VRPPGRKSGRLSRQKSCARCLHEYRQMKTERLDTRHETVCSNSESRPRHRCRSKGSVQPNPNQQPWIVRNDKIPAGKLDKHKIASDQLKNERNLSVSRRPITARAARRTHCWSRSTKARI